MVSHDMFFFGRTHHPLGLSSMKSFLCLTRNVSLVYARGANAKGFFEVTHDVFSTLITLFVLGMELKLSPCDFCHSKLV
jgi:hypothetical protein